MENRSNIEVRSRTAAILLTKVQRRQRDIAEKANKEIMKKYKKSEPSALSDILRNRSGKKAPDVPSAPKEMPKLLDLPAVDAVRPSMDTFTGQPTNATAPWKLRTLQTSTYAAPYLRPKMFSISMNLGGEDQGVRLHE